MARHGQRSLRMGAVPCPARFPAPACAAAHLLRRRVGVHSGVAFLRHQSPAESSSEWCQMVSAAAASEIKASSAADPRLTRKYARLFEQAAQACEHTEVTSARPHQMPL